MCAVFNTASIALAVEFEAERLFSEFLTGCKTAHWEAADGGVNKDTGMSSGKSARTELSTTGSKRMARCGAAQKHYLLLCFCRFISPFLSSRSRSSRSRFPITVDTWCEGSGLGFSFGWRSENFSFFFSLSNFYSYLIQL